jgi:hypothetical protein
VTLSGRADFHNIAVQERDIDVLAGVYGGV